MPHRRHPDVGLNPDTVFLFALCIFAGLSQVAAGAPPGSVEALLPLWAALAWGVCLVVSGTLVLVGVLVKDPQRGDSIELVGRAVFGPFALSYGVAIAHAQPTILSGALAIAPFVGFAFACVVRVVQIVRRRVRALDSREHQ